MIRCVGRDPFRFPVVARRRRVDRSLTAPYPAAAQQEFDARSARPARPANQRRPAAPGCRSTARAACPRRHPEAESRKAGRTPFLVISADFLSPSVASSVFKGRALIAALNAAASIAPPSATKIRFVRRVPDPADARGDFQVGGVERRPDTSTGPAEIGAPPLPVKPFGAVKVGFIGPVA